MRILVLFAITACSFGANYFFQYPVVLWYALFINLFTCIIFCIDAIRIKNNKEPLPTVNLYYFSLIGGVFGGLIGLMVTFFKRKEKVFLGILLCILFFWCFVLYYMYKNYAPFKALFI